MHNLLVMAMFDPEAYLNENAEHVLLGKSLPQTDLTLKLFGQVAIVGEFHHNVEPICLIFVNILELNNVWVFKALENTSFL